jgi:hypothetical protein
VNQRTLVDVPATPKLRPRQAYALELLRDAGTDGLQPVILGALMHDWAGRHPIGRPCDFCASTGNELLRALRRKGVARQRRVDGRTFWQATGLPVERARGMSEDIPY